MSDSPKKSKWQEYKEKNGLIPLDSTNLETLELTDPVAAERLSICRTCPELVSSVNQCKKCGCYIELKAKSDSAKCPLGKW